MYENIGQFFTTSAGAAATLIGLLTVASSIWGKGHTKASSLQESILAESAYSAFANIFFVSLVALEPFINIGYGAIVLAVVGLLSTIRVIRHGLESLEQISKTRARISKTVLLVSVASYVAELIAGILVVLNTDKSEMLLILIYVIIALYAVGLARAWELLGIRKALEES